MKLKILFVLLTCFFTANLLAQKTYKTFELRHFTNSPNANGETDFKGETEWMDFEQRMQFLNDYAEYASRFFDDPGLNSKVVTESEVVKLVNKIKPQPLTKIRETIPLEEWRAYGYNSGQDVKKQQELNLWSRFPGASIEEGVLKLEDGSIEKSIESLSWRFKLKTKIKLEEGSSCSLVLSGDRKNVIEVNLSEGKLETVSNGDKIIKKVQTSDWLDLMVEGDFTQKRFNLYVNDERLVYYIPMVDTLATSIDKLMLKSSKKVFFDDLFIFNHTPTDNVKAPYVSSVVIDENFEQKPNVEGWQNSDFNDESWELVNLPSVHGGVLEKGENYYLRKKVKTGSFKCAILELETLDPGGEIWVNNQVAAVINSRHPIRLDITDYLKQNSTNIIAVKVKPWKLNNPMHHTPSDHYIGWFLGRASLLLSGKCMIKDVLIHSESIGSPAGQSHKIHISNKGIYYFEGSLTFNYYPWFPEEGGQVASYTQKVQVRPNIENEFVINVPIFSPTLWTYNAPFLYKVEVILKDKDGNPVDDFVTTTGIRKVGQKNGDFIFNDKPDMLNGAQIMGFRMPIESISKISRCAPIETIAEELLSIKKMGGNLLRMHVHAQNDTADGINDPRYAELADQLGLCLIWQTAGWVRNGDAWNIDFDGYPEYMKQVFNHPSIVMWEASNHPNLFKTHEIEDTHDFIKKCYNTIYSTDQSRIISPTSFWQHIHYANYEGTMDYKGNKIQPVPEYMAELVTRGSQDAYTGYGRDWSKIRNAPNEWAASCLAANEKAYFNFEHEESIGQPNWELCKGKPWYLLHSYEHKYDSGSIGRNLVVDEWKASQAWQAFSAWESMKKQVLLGYDGFSWCCLHGGANMGTYKKPLIDCLGHAKLSFYVNRMVFQPAWAGSNNVDVVYGPGDYITPAFNYFGEGDIANLKISLKNLEGKIIDKKEIKGIVLEKGHTMDALEAFRFRDVSEGNYIIEYELTVNGKE
ncbi:MAG: hypothetical protein JW833_13390 [Prolixibacteraceae bacterium]|nr:hypothetical protein [Prolixibacteraceae bacterium]